jgi:hypothetical protein
MKPFALELDAVQVKFNAGRTDEVTAVRAPR